MTRVRIRGIYATALAKVFLDEGIELSDLSQKMKERLGIEGSPEAPHVTVKHSDKDLDELIVVGFPDHADKVIDVLRRHFPHSPHHLARPNLHSSYKVEVKEGCEVEVEGIRAKLKSRECYPGKVTVAEVVRAKVRPDDNVIMEEGFRIIGLYVEIIVGRGPGVSFSRHITNPSMRTLLASLAADITARGFGVRWRSAARSASLDVLREELEKLLDEAYKIELKLDEIPVGSMVYPGERLDVIDLVLEDKEIMDNIRRYVLPTMSYHHSLKSGGDKMSAAVELGDKISAKSKVPEECVREYLYDVIKDSKKIKLIHKKVNGKIIVLGTATFKGRVEDYVVLQRTIREYGMYDGIEKVKEPGDKILTFLKPFARHLIHAYFSQYGELKGIYVNINTGVEVGEGSVRYLDLEADVIIVDGRVSVIDKEELDTLPPELRSLAEEEIRLVLQSVERIERLVGEGEKLVF